MSGDEDALKSSELAPVGGSWTGLLMENEHTGLPLSLVWTFAVEFEPVERDFGGTYPELVVDWAPLEGASWNSMTGRQFEASRFAEPAEGSVYFFGHHRFDRTRVVVREQVGSKLRVMAEVGGDVDGLGIDRIAVESWLSFGGIYVQPKTKPDSVEAARDLLQRFTDTDGLVGVEREANCWFKVEAPESSSQ